MFTLGKSKILTQLLSKLFVLCLVVAFAHSTLGFSQARAAAANVGYKDFAFGSAYAPTGEKPQSKLWFNDGIWWGVMYNKASSSKHFEIYRFNWATDTWTTTGAMVDARTKSSSDALWTGSKLYTVSNVSPSATGDVTIYVMRYSYNSTTKTYSLDSGFPVAVYNHGVETVVMDQDTTGKLWVTFTDANSSGGRNTYVTHTTSSDTTWITPYVVPVPGAATLKSDDISTIVAYSGKIGVMWSNQNNSTVYFAYHPDGTADNNWIVNPAVQSPKYADDHLNIKSLQADSAGQLFAVVKTSLNDVNPSSSTKPLVLLLQLDNHGGWSRRTVWQIVDNVTRPIVLLDQQNRTIYAFTTGNYGTQDSGAIYYKSVSMDNPSMQFVDGLGTPFIVSSTDTHINNASSTKQTLNTTTNLLVIAGDDTSNYYFHNKIMLGTGNPTPASTATNTSTPVNTLTPTRTFTPAPAFTPTSTPTLGPTPTKSPTATNPNTPGATFTPTPASTASGSDLIFADGFESGNLSAWTSASTDGGDLSTSPLAALVGNQGLRAVVNDSNSMYLTDNSPNAEAHYRVRFYFDPNSVAMASGDYQYLLTAFANATDTTVFRVQFKIAGGAYQVRLRNFDDSQGNQNTPYVTISDAPHAFEVEWSAAKAAGANDGFANFWIDGVPQGSLTGIDNDTYRLERVRLGLTYIVNGGTSGVEYFDAFEARRQTYVGP